MPISTHASLSSTRPVCELLRIGGRDFWARALFCGVLLAAALLPWYWDLSAWLGVAIAFSVVVVAHMAVASRFVVVLPHVALLFGLMQLVLAAWWEHYYPPQVIPNIGDRLDDYLSFAVPSLLALSCGFAVSALKLPVRPRVAHVTNRLEMNQRLLRELDLLVFGGLALALVQRNLNLGGGAFLLLLISQLRFVGVFGWMLLGAKGWRARLLAVAILQLFICTQSAMFQDTLLWAVAFACVAFYRFGTRRKTVVACVLAGLILIPIVEHAKLRLRDQFWYGRNPTIRLAAIEIEARSLPRAVVWGLLWLEGTQDLLTGQLTEKDYRHLAERYNQGWIVNRVMEHVPANEPFANGETIAATIESVFLPRLLFSNKPVAFGREKMIRYAGYTPARTASMNLGYCGEMYANFGYLGGIVGVGLYGLLFGGMFRWLARRAAGNPLWWMFAPFVGHVALKAEDGLTDVTNWAAKAALVAAAVIYGFPTIRAVLLPRVPAKD